jgi:hypothetical protein
MSNWHDFIPMDPVFVRNADPLPPPPDMNDFMTRDRERVGKIVRSKRWIIDILKTSLTPDQRLVVKAVADYGASYVSRHGFIPRHQVNALVAGRGTLTPDQRSLLFWMVRAAREAAHARTADKPVPLFEDRVPV